jgi:hypothetical protein
VIDKFARFSCTTIFIVVERVEAAGNLLSVIVYVSAGVFFVIDVEPVARPS